MLIPFQVLGQRVHVRFVAAAISEINRRGAQLGEKELDGLGRRRWGSDDENCAALSRNLRHGSVEHHARHIAKKRLHVSPPAF